MRKKRLGNFIYENLKNSNPFSLKLLYEDADEVEVPKNDPTDKNKELGDEDDVEEETPEEGSQEGGDKGKDPAVTAQELSNSLEDLKKAARRRNKSPIKNPRGVVSNIVSSGFSKNLKDFALVSEAAEDSEDFIKDLEKTLGDNEELIDKIDTQKEKLTQGTELDIEEEVFNAIDKLKNFNNKVNIVALVEELFIEKISIMAPLKDVDKNIEDFKAMYNEEVEKNLKDIDIPGSEYYNNEEYVTRKTGKFNGAVGAKSSS